MLSGCGIVFLPALPQQHHSLKAYGVFHSLAQDFTQHCVRPGNTGYNQRTERVSSGLLNPLVISYTASYPRTEHSHSLQKAHLKHQLKPYSMGWYPLGVNVHTESKTFICARTTMGRVHRSWEILCFLS